jgi:predicted ATPase
MEELRKIQYGVYYIVFLCEYADALSLAGQPQQGLVMIEEALKRCESNEENWYVAELLRVKGEILRLGGADAAAEAMKLFQLSLDWSRRQGTLSWELRAATSLARLHIADQRPHTSLNLLRTIYNKFAEGEKSADLVLARHLLDEAPTGVLQRRQL